MKKTKKPVETELYFEGNNGGNYLKISKWKGDDRLIFLEVGDCCVVTFRGVLTVEMLSNFFTNVAYEKNTSLIEVIKDKMTWSKEVNEKVSADAKTLKWNEV